MRSMALAIILLLICSGSITADEIHDRESELKDTKTMLDSTRMQIEQLLDEQTELQQGLRKDERRLRRSRWLRWKYNRSVEQLSSRIDSASYILSNSQSDLTLRRSEFGKQLRELYLIAPEHGELPSFNPGGAIESERDDYLAKRLILFNLEQLRETDADLQVRQSTIDSLAESKSGFADLSDRHRSEAREARQALKEGESHFAEVQIEKSHKQHQLKELEETALLLGMIVDDLDLQNPPDLQIEARERELVLQFKGDLHWPVRGEMIVPFGLRKNKHSGIATRNSGIKIATVAGRKVVAALTGKVVYIGWVRGLENFLVVDHGGSVYTLYGNLAEIIVSEGEAVIRGEPFAVTATEELHFELRDGKNSIDPLKWLKK